MGRRRSGTHFNADQARFCFGPEPSIDDIGAIVDGYQVFRVNYQGAKTSM